MARLLTCLISSLALSALGDPWEADLRRAKTRTPRAEFRGQGSLASANSRLNKHLGARRGLRLKECEKFTVEEVRDLLRVLFPRTSDELKNIYPEKDGRHPKYNSVAEMEGHWVREAPASDVRLRDAHCHEAVMMFIHHITSDLQQMLANEIVLPTLPVRDHSVATRDETDVVGKFYDAKITCQTCHVGGIESLGVPEVKPETEKAKARRCYTNYKELFNVTCGPCDGIAGPYWGDSDDKFTPTPCVVVGEPDAIPEGERVKPALPNQFSVDVVGGSDRFGRTTNPVHDQLPGPIAKLYGQIYGKWFMDVKNPDLWLLRHDTVYASLTEDGTPIPFVKPSVSEIHAQTAKDRATNCTGQMVSLIHGMPSFLPGGCTCMPDPVGVPDTQAFSAIGMSKMQYMGRITLPKLEYLNTPITLDHWASWFFHIFMDVNKSVPHYGKAPSRLASAYAGTAVYDNWVMEDPKIKDPEVWHRGIPTKPMRVGPDKGKMCMNTKKSPICDDIRQDNFPPQPAPAVQASVPTGHQASLAPFFPTGHGLGEHIARARAESTEKEFVV